MTNFNDLCKNPKRFLSFTGFTLEEFLALLPIFALKFQQYMEQFTIEGKKREKRKYVEYKNACLPLVENKLLFILTYLKGNDLQERIAEMFGISQPKANIWIHLLNNVLNQALEEAEVLPARDADSLEKNLNKLKEETTERIEIEATEPETKSIEQIAKVETVDYETESPEPITEVKTIKTETKSIEPIAKVETVEYETKSPEPITEVKTIKPETKTNEPMVGIEDMEIITMFLHDGTERPINRPIHQAIQEIFYSGRKKQHTLKNILLTDVSGYVHFLSDTCEGKKSDKKIADETGYSLPIGSYLGQDTGFQGFEIPGVDIVQPKKKPRGGELTKEEKERNCIISRVRVRVEHAIGGVKRCRIVKDKIRNWKHGFKDKVMETCCGLHNFRLKFRPWNYEMAVI